LAHTTKQDSSQSPSMQTLLMSVLGQEEQEVTKLGRKFSAIFLSLTLRRNYAPGILPALEASQKGYQQILWLNGDNITEVGTMNLFGFWKNKNGDKELITANLDGTILPGVTRKSILELAKTWGEFKVTERPWTMAELVTALQENRVR
jgi:hypothetical protein